MPDYMGEVNEGIAKAAKKLLDNAVENIAARLPNDSEKEDFLRRIDEIETQGIRAVIEGRDYQKYLEQGAYETSVWVANHYANATLKYVAKKLPKGKAKNEIFSVLHELSRTGIEGVCSGDSIDEIKCSLKKCAKMKLKSYAEQQTQRWADDIGDSMYNALRTHGHGSRRINYHIKNSTNLIASEFGSQLIVNFSDVIDGKKDAEDAIVDITVNTARNAGKQYIQQNGAELAADVIKELAKRAEKEIKNKALRNVTTTTLGKLSNPGTLMQVAGAAVEVGRALKQLADGEITKADFLRMAGEKGTAFVVSSFFSIAGTAIGGPVGGVVAGMIGSAVAYFSTSFLYGSLMQAFEEAELSRKRYEAVHEFCEYSIEKLERDRQEFLRVTSKLFANREKVIHTNLTRYEMALRQNNLDEVSTAFGNIAKEFGMEWEPVTRDEVYRLITDKDAILEL